MMNEMNVFEQIRQYAEVNKLPLSVDEIARLAAEKRYSESDLSAIAGFMEYMAEKKKRTVIDICMKTSRLPRENPKTFENFDFSRVRGEDVELLKNLVTLSPLYAHQNLAFIGPPGIGKTHLAMAFGHLCCQKGMKVYFTKATELNSRFTRARKTGTEESTVDGMVRPSVLIVDEVGNCMFDIENTRLFFDVIDRRSAKEGPNCMIFTSNKVPNTWKSYFMEQEALLCSLDRIFDDAAVFMLKGESYRGKRLRTIPLEVGTK